MKKLSIIVPIYNVAIYLCECVESLLAQSYPNFEIILVDDGSTDNSGEICDKYSVNDNIKVVHQKNRGLPHARNAGLEVAEGEYIGFIDSDDIVSEDMFAKLIAALEQTDAEMAVCNFKLFNKNGIYAVSSRYKDEVIEYSDSNEVLFCGCGIDSSCNKVYRHEIIKDYSLFFEDKSVVAQEDFWFVFRYCMHISKIVSISEALYLYRERRSSISRSRVDNDITSRCINFIQLSDEFSSHVGRRSIAFLDHLTLDMMFASINQTPNPIPGHIRRMVIAFSETKYYHSAILRNDSFRGGIQGHYERVRLILLRAKLYRLFSLLEYIRVKRLRKQKKVQAQYE